MNTLKHLLLAVFSFCFLSSYGQTTFGNCLRINLKERDCYLVYRKGIGKESDIIRLFSYKDPSYTHVGICFIENDMPFVYHVIGGETNLNSIMKREPLASFIDTITNSKFGIYKIKTGAVVMQRLRSFIIQKYLEKTFFDYEFSLENQEQYCSELIINGLREASRGRIDIKPILSYRSFPPIKPIKFYYYPVDILLYKLDLEAVFIWRKN